MLAAPAQVAQQPSAWASYARRLEWAALLYLIAISAGAFGFADVLIFGAAYRKTSESLFAQALWPLAYALFFGLALARRHELIIAATRCWWLLPFPLAVALSFVWSLDPSSTLNAAVRIAATTGMALYIGTRFDLIDQTRAVFWVLGLTVGASLLSALAALDFASMADGTVRGLFRHKNTLGSRAALLLAAALVLLQARRRPLLAMGGVMVGTIATAISQSAAGVILGALAVLAAPIALALRARAMGLAFRLAVLGAIACFGLFAVAALRIDPITEILAALDRDPTLTGRIWLWGTALGHIAERPVLGFGFDAFWSAGVDWQTFRVLDRLGSVLNFHNSFLEVGVQLGIMGMAIALFTAAVYLRAALAALRLQLDPAALWPALFGVIVFALAMVENELFVKHNLLYIVFLALPVAVFRQMDERHPAPAPAPRRAPAEAALQGVGAAHPHHG